MPQEDDYLYVMINKGEFYRLSRDQITDKQNRIDADADAVLNGYLVDLFERQSVLADVKQGAATSDSCVCIALNIGYLERTTLEPKVEKQRRQLEKAKHDSGHRK